MEQNKSLPSYDLGDSEMLVEDCVQVSVGEVLNEYKKQLKQQLLSSVFEVDGVSVKLNTTRTNFGGSRHWFVCPSCSKRKGKLLRTPEGEIGCNSCLEVSYQSTRYKGMVETAL
jgi:hypothetical protein